MGASSGHVAGVNCAVCGWACGDGDAICEPGDLEGVCSDSGEGGGRGGEVRGGASEVD